MVGEYERALLSTVDDSPPDGSAGVLTGFVTGAAATAFSALSATAQRDAALAHIGRIFPQLPAPTQCTVTDWLAEKYSRGGCYAALFGPGDWLNLGADADRSARPRALVWHRNQSGVLRVDGGCDQIGPAGRGRADPRRRTDTCLGEGAVQMTSLTEAIEPERAGFAAAVDQPYTYVRRNLSEPDWRRYPLGTGHRGAVARSAMAAGALRQDHRPATRRGGRPARRWVLRRSGRRSATAGDHVDAGAAADAQHHGRALCAGAPLVDGGLLHRSGPALHVASPQRPRAGVGIAPPTPNGIRYTKAICGWWRD